MQSENARYVESHEFFTNELQKLSNSFENITLGKKMTDKIEQRIAEVNEEKEKLVTAVEV